MKVRLLNVDPESGQFRGLGRRRASGTCFQFSPIATYRAIYSRETMMD